MRDSVTKNVWILLVEDNAINQLVAQAMLKRLGYQCIIAAHGLEALEHLTQQPFDLVLMDCQMPKMDGFETTRQIRAGNCGASDPQIPIIALSGQGPGFDEQTCLAAGMNDSLGKPFSLQALNETLNRWLPRT